MSVDETRVESPAKGIWLRFLVLIPLAIALIVGSYAYIRSVCSTISLWTPVYYSDIDFTRFGLDDVKFSNPGVVEAVGIEYGAQGAARITFEAIKDGETNVEFGDARSEVFWTMSVQQDAIVVGGADFSGWESIHISLCIFLGALVVLFASALVRLARRSWFGYEMVACGGGLLFCLFQFLLFTALFIRGSLLTFSDMAFGICEAASYFVMLSLAPMAVLALLVSLSNISLIRHEGGRPANLLGIAISVVWVAAILLWLHWWAIGRSLDWSFQVLQLVDSVIAAAISFGECLLLSTIACAWLASRHVPQHRCDYLVVLGCGIRADGMPSPLLAGRVDKALAFDRARVATGDAPATFVPSGGQGPDEVVSEAQSMGAYLEQAGVSPERIVLEDRSTSTLENMVFSRQVIQEHAGCGVEGVSVAFSTTNYHVFRGYVCAHRAGMAAEGMGSKTRAYFWPNAFLREFAGLLAAQWRSILQTFLVLAAVYAVAEYVLLLS